MSKPIQIQDKDMMVFEVLGMCGAMLSGSKRGYDERYPNHLVFYNANIFDSQANKLWFGDLDLTIQIDKLQELASALGGDIFVTRETPFRFNPPTPEQLQDLADKPHSGIVRIVTAEGQS